jgi:hypothetical protein
MLTRIGNLPLRQLFFLKRNINASVSQFRLCEFSLPANWARSMRAYPYRVAQLTLCSIEAASHVCQAKSDSGLTCLTHFARFAGNVVLFARCFQRIPGRPPNSLPRLRVGKASRIAVAGLFPWGNQEVPARNLVLSREAILRGPPAPDKSVNGLKQHINQCRIQVLRKGDRPGGGPSSPEKSCTGTAPSRPPAPFATSRTRARG